MFASRRTGFVDGRLGKHGSGRFYYHHFIKARYAQAELTNSLGITWKIPFFSPNIIALCSFSLREGWPLVPNLIILLFVNRKFLFEEYRH